MVQTIQAKEIDLRYLIENFGLQRSQDDQFFREWQDNLPEITESQKQLLDQVRDGYFNLLDYPPLLEDIIRIAIVDPILFISGFFLYPFYIKSEQSVELVTEDNGVIIKGKIDTLVLRERLWVMVIEAKRASYSPEAGLAQILSYMLSNPNPKEASYGMITNGGSFLFLKLLKSDQPIYARSNLFAMQNPGDLYTVMQIIKKLSNIVNNN
jgi:predicted type IV restriction endonuclease